MHKHFMENLCGFKHINMIKGPLLYKWIFLQYVLFDHKAV